MGRDRMAGVIESGAARPPDADDAGDVGTSADVGLERHRHRAHGCTPIVRPHGVRALWVVGRHLTRTDVTRLAVEPLLVRCRPDIHDDGRDPSIANDAGNVRQLGTLRVAGTDDQHRHTVLQMTRLTWFSNHSWRPDTGCGSRSSATAAVGQRRKVDRAVEDGPAPLRPTTAIPIVAVGIQRAVGDQRLGHQQRPGQRVDAADVTVEQVAAVETLPAQLGVEVEPAVREAAAPQDLVEHERQLVDGVRELVGVPPVLGITAVGVDTAEQTVLDRVGHLVVERVAGEGGVVALDVHLELAVEPVAARNPWTVAVS